MEYHNLKIYSGGRKTALIKKRVPMNIANNRNRTRDYQNIGLVFWINWKFTNNWGYF